MNFVGIDHDYNHSNLLKLEGRSGCELQVFKVNGRILVRKVSSAINYNQRLTAQANKQISFKTHNPFRTFDTPFVLGQSMVNNYQCFDMMYIQGDKFSDFLWSIDVGFIDHISKEFLAYLEYYVGQSKMTSPPIHRIKTKLQKLQCGLEKQKIYPPTFVKGLLLYLYENIPPYPLPKGHCHGDLTFSNMIFSRTGKIYLIDFLDSFIESPLVDLVKLRQDTRWLWSLLIDQSLEPHKRCKVKQIFRSMDQKFTLYLDRQSLGFKCWYQYLEIFNLARIMPYVVRREEVQFLRHHLQKLLF